MSITTNTKFIANNENYNNKDIINIFTTRTILNDTI